MCVRLPYYSRSRGCGSLLIFHCSVVLQHCSHHTVRDCVGGLKHKLAQRDIFNHRCLQGIRGALLHYDRLRLCRRVKTPTYSKMLAILAWVASITVTDHWFLSISGFHLGAQVDAWGAEVPRPWGYQRGGEISRPKGQSIIRVQTTVSPSFPLSILSLYNPHPGC